MPTFTGAAIVQAIPTLDFTGVPIRPEVYAGVLQRLLSDLVSQGYEVLSVTPMPGAILCAAVQRAGRTGVTVTEYPRVRFYGCEGLTCRPNAHTLDCPNIDQSG